MQQLRQNVKVNPQDSTVLQQKHHITWEIQISPAFNFIWMCSLEGFVDREGSVCRIPYKGF